MPTDFDALVAEAFADQTARCAATENDLRRHIAQFITRECRKRDWDTKRLAANLGVSLAQTRRLLHAGLGGTLSVNTLVRAADLFRRDLTVTFKERK